MVGSVAGCGEQLGETADQHEVPPPGGQICVGSLSLPEQVEAVGERVADIDRSVLFDEGEELGEEIGRQMLLGPATDAALERLTGSITNAG
ncbi:MAG: hypothetical protein ACR2HM_04390 [Acidimicrobiales bacterium]